MKDTFIIVRASTIQQLKLKGLDLLIYSIIDGICQHTGNKFTGSQNYLAKLTGYSKRSVRDSLAKLTDKKLLIKEELFINNVKFCTYVTNFHSGEETSVGVGKKLPQGGEETSPNNIEDNIYDNIKNIQESFSPTQFSEVEESNNTSAKHKEKEKEKNTAKKEKETAQKVINEFNRVCVSMPKVQKVTSERRKSILNRLKCYSMDEIFKAFKTAQNSDFLTGRKTNWRANFDWLFSNDKNITKILEGNYDNTKNATTGNNQNNISSVTTGKLSGEELANLWGEFMQ